MILTLLKPFSWASRRYSSTTAFTSRGGIVCRSKISVISISTGSGNGLSGSNSSIRLRFSTSAIMNPAFKLFLLLFASLFVAPDVAADEWRGNATTFSALQVDKRRFKSFDPSTRRNRGYRGYIDDKAGLLLKSLSGEIF